MSSGIERRPESDPDPELLESWLGVTLDFELRPGETLTVDTPEGERSARRFRDVLGRFASGVTVVTALVDGRPVGMTAQAFSSVSLDPPLVLFCPARTSRAWPLMEQVGSFCVNLLAHDQAELSEKMAARGTDKFDRVSWVAVSGHRVPAAGGRPRVRGLLGARRPRGRRPLRGDRPGARPRRLRRRPPRPPLLRRPLPLHLTLSGARLLVEWRVVAC